MSRIHFETSLEKLARILARQHNINVVFEGNQACTDGKTITLPSMDGNLSDELRRDLSAFLDHEVAHCKFSTFDAKIDNKFHKLLTNATEDIRIERLMGDEFPGAALNLQELREKVDTQTNAGFDKLPWPIKVIVATQKLMNGKPQVITDDIKEYVPVIKEFVPKFNEAKSEKEIAETARTLMRKIIEKVEEEEKPEPKSGKSKSGFSKEDLEKIAKMMSEGEGEKDSEFDKHVFDVHGMMDEKIKKEIKESKPATEGTPSGKKDHDWTMGVNASVPVTTKYDKVNDMVGKGNAASYARLKAEVMPMVSAIKSHFEKVLKVKENAHWKSEREQGTVNAKALARLATDKNYRYPFKEFRKTDTKNVAVEILVDMSGSMGGEKIRVAKMSAIAMAEALKALDIPFEVTGFTSVGDSRVGAEAKKHKDLKRFNRYHERLELFVFKDFDAPSLIGIEKMEAMSNNPDGECVKWAANRLINRKEKRKILIVLSDGMPAADGDFKTLNYDLKLKVQQIMKSGIECVGLGVLTDAVKHFYPDHVVIKDLKTLPSETMSKLCKIIAR
jgi:cobalamin biosynthesis protein CobT